LYLKKDYIGNALRKITGILGLSERLCPLASEEIHIVKFNEETQENLRAL
jgi:hypothetical protein